MTKLSILKRLRTQPLGKSRQDYDDGPLGDLDLDMAAIPPARPTRRQAREAFLDHNTTPRLLASAMLLEALSEAQRRRIGKRNGVAIVVEVAHPDMINHVSEALHVSGAFSETYKRSGASRTNDKPEIGNDRVAEALSNGGNVAGISQAPERYLPATLLASADIRITLAKPSPAAVRAIIRLVTGRSPKDLPVSATAGLGFLDVCAALRRNSTMADCVRRLAAAASAKRIVLTSAEAPHLRDTFGYEGPALE